MVRRTRQVTAVITATCLAAFAAPAPAPAAPAPARWHQVAELKGSDVVADDSFGDGVAISGGTVVVARLTTPTGGVGPTCSRTAPAAGTRWPN